MREIDGRASAYVCRDYACERPVTARDDLQSMLAIEPAAEGEAEEAEAAEGTGE
jgi:hypothetical protein